MTTRAGWWWLMVVGVPACGDTASSPAANAEGQKRRICPSCVSEVAGSETSDFGGSTDACTGVPMPLPEDTEWGARLAEVSDVYGGPFQATLLWAYTSQVEPSSAAAFWEARPSGYEAESTVSGEVVLGAAQFYQGRPVAGVPATTQCPDFMRVPATIELATGDGALAGTAQGTLYLGVGPSRLQGQLDLADATGTLELHLDAGLEYRAGAELTFQFYPEGKRGEISLSVQPASPSSTQESGYWPLTSSFPDDGCGSTGFPGTTDVPLPWLDGQTAAQALQWWNTALQQQTIDGRRHDCAPGTREDSPVALTFEIGAPKLQLCQVPAWPAARSDGSFSFTGPTRLRTQDDRLDFSFASGSVAPNRLVLSSDQSRTPWSGPGAVLIPAAQFEAESGIRGVHLGSGELLGYYGEAYFYRQEAAILAGGTLMVQSLSCTSDTSCLSSIHSDVRWPMDEDATIPLCRL